MHRLTRLFLFVSLFVGISGFFNLANASPLYTVGQTLDPSCLPSNPDCTVLLTTSTTTGAYFIATSTTAENTFPVMTNGIIADVHPDGSTNYYNATSTGNAGNANGNALLAAVANAQSGDTLYLSDNTFDVGDYPIDLSLGRTGSISVYGTGKFGTLVEGGASLQSNFCGVFCPASNSTVANMSITNYNSGEFDYFACWGSFNGISFSNAVVQNVNCNSSTDGVYVKGTNGNDTFSLINDTISTNWDTVVMDSPTSTMYMFDDNLSAYASITEEADGVYVSNANGPGDTVYIYNTTMDVIGKTSHNPLNNSPYIYGINNQGANVYVYNGSITTVANTSPTVADINGGAWVNSGVSYNPTKSNGVKYLDATTTQYSLGSSGASSTILMNENGVATWVSTSSLGLSGANYFSNFGATTTLSTGSLFSATRGTFGAINATGTLTVSGNSIFTNASTTNISASGFLNVIGTTTTTGLSVGSLSGLLLANNGIVSAISTSSLGIPNYWTLSGTTTTNTVAAIASTLGVFGSIQATSTTSTSTFAGASVLHPTLSVNPTTVAPSLSMTPLIQQIVNFATTSTMNPHGTAEANGMLFAGTLTGYIYVLKTPDTNLANVQVTRALFPEWIAEMRYATTTGYLYTCSGSGILKILPSDITNESVLYSGGFGGAPGCDTDGTYMYVVSMSAPAMFYKIRLSDGTLMATSTWTGVNYGHSLALDPNGQYFYANTGSGDNGHIAKVSTSNLTVSSVAAPGTGETFTDDSVVDNGLYYVGSETNPFFYILNPTSMTLSTTTACSQSYGIFTDTSAGGNGNNLYDLGINGCLSYFPNGSTTQRYDYNYTGLGLGTIGPNEMWVTPQGRIIMTDWFSNRVLSVDLGLNQVGVGTQNPNANLQVAGSLMADAITGFNGNFQELTVNAFTATTTTTGTFTSTGAINGGQAITATGNITGNNLLSNNSISAGIFNSSTRGILDISNASTSIFATSPVSVAVTPFSGNLHTGSGAVYSFTLIPYQVINGTTYYSSVSTTTSWSNTPSFSSYYLTVSWSSVPAASGYKIVITDPQDGYTGNYYIATTTTSFIYGKGCETSCVVNQSPMVTTPVDTLANLFVSSTTGVLNLLGPTGGLYVAPTLDVGIGTSSPIATLSITGTTGTLPFIIASSSNSQLVKVGPDGSLQLNKYGAGTLTTDANGNVTLSSDERLKNIQGDFTKGLSAIMGLVPINYTWKASTGLDTVNTYTGFSAQNVQQYIPEAVGSSSDGTLTLQDRPLLATLVNAIKELALSIGDSIKAVTGFFYNLTIGSPTNPSGITLYDKVTGEPYCVVVSNGQLEPISGACTIITISTSTDSTSTSTDTVATESSSTAVDAITSIRTASTSTDGSSDYLSIATSTSTSTDSIASSTPPVISTSTNSTTSPVISLVATSTPLVVVPPSASTTPPVASTPPVSTTTPVITSPTPPVSTPSTSPADTTNSTDSASSTGQ